MTEEDLPAVEAWLRLSHVARWWTPDTAAGAEIAEYRERVRQDSKSATYMLVVTLGSTPVGWCQWYRWADYPADAEAMSARDAEIGIDYAIGDPRPGRPRRGKPTDTLPAETGGLSVVADDPAVPASRLLGIRLSK
jgi:Acetyltransferase (GNAT) domain